MKKVVLVALLIVSAVFSYNTVLGNRGTFGVYSGACEDMGMLTFNLNAYGTMINIDSIVAPDTTATTAQLTEILPYVGISFTPWHYLEFGVWGHGRWADFGNYSSSVDELYGNLGFSVKGGVPIYFNQLKRSYFAPGIDGFAYMQGIGTNVFGFGGRGLLTLRLNWFGLHLNGGYEYVTIGAGAQNVLTGAALEVWPFRWMGIIADGTACIPQNDFGNFMNYLHVTPGFRFGFGGRVFKCNINLGVEMEPMQTPFRWRALAGVGLGFDLMPPPMGYIDGIVIDKITQEPVADARIFIEGYNEIGPTSSGDDGRFSIDKPEGTYALVAEHSGYVSTRVESDLIEAEHGVVVIELAPTGGAIVLGIVSEVKNNNPIAATLRFVSITTDTVIPTFKSDPVAGYYRAVVPEGTYRIDVTAPGYKKVHKSVMVTGADEVVVDFKMEKAAPPPTPDAVAFSSVYFGRGETVVTGGDYAALNQAVEVLKANPDVRVRIQGHTDSVGDSGLNHRISIRRAEAVRNYLLASGISPDRMIVEGYGESRPRGDNRTNRGRDINRRVDILAM